MKNEEANAIRLYEEKKQKEEKQQTELEERTCLRASLLNGELTEKVVANNVKRQKELEQQQEKAMNLHHSLTVQAESYKGQIAQLEKELVPSDCCFATRRVENKRVAHSSKGNVCRVGTIAFQRQKLDTG